MGALPRSGWGPAAASALLAVCLALSGLAPAAAAAGEAPAASPAGERALEAVRSAATEHDVEPERLLAAPVTLETVGTEGPAGSWETTVRQAVAELVPDGRLASSTLPGGGEASAGDVFHLYVNVAAGESALAYEVRTAPVVPGTPPVFPPGPGAGLVFDVGGPARTVQGDYLLGVHTAGTVVGSNVETSGPYLPVVDAALVFDTSVDFAGHANVTQGEDCVDGICVAVGFMLATGAALWDAEDPSIPTVPPFPSPPEDPRAKSRG